TLRPAPRGQGAGVGRPRGDVERPDRLAGVAGEPLGFLDPPARDEQLGEAALALAEVCAVADRLQKPDRLTEALLRPLEGAGRPSDPGAQVQGPRDRPDGAGLGEEPFGLRGRLLSLLEVALPQVELAP